jgi:altronate hydrolase
MKQKTVQINKQDNVLVALQDLTGGEQIDWDGEYITLIKNIPAKHKISLKNFFMNDSVIMYGVLVGRAQTAISKGDLMTTENVKHDTGKYYYRSVNYQWKPPDTKRFDDRFFSGYHRSDGRVGTANYWLFIPLVFCENRNMDVIKEALQNELGYADTEKYKLFTRSLVNAYQDAEDVYDLQLHPSMEKQKRIFPNVDGIKFLNHQGGCGGTRQDAAVLGKLLAAYANHPNVGGITVLSLGCQNLQLKDFLAELKIANPSFEKPLFLFEQQQTKSEEQLITDAMRKTFNGLIEINQLKRQPAPLYKLCIGVKCGGSDGFSGISANPAVGYCADLLAALGGQILLAEFPELCGMEQEIIDRCTDETAAKKFIYLMQSYEDITVKSGSGFHMNPSPGNIKDGLITDAMKSAGAAKKGGSSPVVDVLNYTEQATKPGLSLVCTPGNDVEATTGKTASGATLILFTTGLGTPTGNPVCPTIKIATNTVLSKRMSDIIDIDAGPVIDGEKSIEQMGEEILEYCIKVANGEILPKAVLLNQDDFIPWKRGVSL